MENKITTPNLSPHHIHPSLQTNKGFFVILQRMRHLWRQRKMVITLYNYPKEADQSSKEKEDKLFAESITQRFDVPDFFVYYVHKFNLTGLQQVHKIQALFDSCVNDDYILEKDAGQYASVSSEGMDLINFEGFLRILLEQNKIFGSVVLFFTGLILGLMPTVVEYHHTIFLFFSRIF